jgi:hypothetical protein
MDESQNKDPRKESNLEEIQRKLYSKHYTPKHKRAKLRGKEYNIDNDWEPGNEPKQSQTQDFSSDYWGPNSNNDVKEKKSLGGFAIVLVAAMLFFIGSLGYAYYTFNEGTKRVSGEDVTINVIGPVSIGGGEPLSMDVIITNNNIVPLELVDLIVDYPAGTKDSEDLRTDLRRDRIPLGDIAPGEISRKTISAALFGEENSSQEIVVSVEYRLEGSNAIFEKERPFDIVLSASPVRLVVSGLREVSAGQEIEITTKLSSNSTKTLEDVVMTARYPFGFEYISANIEPSSENDIWVFDTLEPEEEKEVVITGVINGQNEEDRVFRFSTGIQSDETEGGDIGILWGSVLHETSIKKGFASLNLLLNNSSDPDQVVSSGESVLGVLTVSNNTSDSLRNVNLEIELVGNAVDKESVSVTNGFYNSLRNTLVWNSETDDRFEELLPRESYILNFRFDAIDFNQNGNLIADPTIQINSNLSSIRVSEDNVEENIDTEISTALKVLSEVGTEVYTMYDGGPFENYGPVPPRAENETSYTVVFEISNSTNNLENVKVETTLPSYVQWNNLVSPANANITYDTQSRRLVWNAGEIKAGVGYVTNPKTLYLNVIATPSLSQVGQQINLILDPKLTAYDTFTQTNITQELDVTGSRIFDRSLGDNHESVTQ